MFRLAIKTKKGLRFGLVCYNSLEEAQKRAEELNSFGKHKYIVKRV